MTRVEFYVNVPDKLRKVIELGENIVSRGRRLMVYVPDTESASRLEGLVWTHPPTGFLPHCRADNALAAVTPVIIDWRSEQLAHDDVLINLRAEYPTFFSRFRRLIEIVGADEADKVEARNRYRFYRDRGYEIKSFDMLEAEQP
ncbi:MAG TPA: DNA polymerase III subunit chi [Methylophilaceae bacterium]|nr:DNA polymerase III subunit chi [Methylophilaceae bacterium]